VRNVTKQLEIPSLLYLLFYDAFSDHAFLFLCVSIHLEADLSTEEERRAHKTEVDYRGGPVPLPKSFLSLHKPNKLSRPESAESQTIPARIKGDLRVSCEFLDFFFFWIFFFNRGIGPCGPVLPPPLEWISSPPLVAVVLITTKGDESPGSSRMGVIGALFFFFHLSPFRINFTLPDRPSSALRQMRRSRIL